MHGLNNHLKTSLPESNLEDKLLTQKTVFRDSYGKFLKYLYILCFEFLKYLEQAKLLHY